MAKFNVQKDTARTIQFVLTDDESNRYNLVDANNVTFIVTEINPKEADVVKIEKLMSIIDRNTGLVQVSLLNTDTALDVDTYEYSISINFGADDNRIVDQGLFAIYEDDFTSRIEQIKAKYGLSFNMSMLKEEYRIARNNVKNNILENVKYDIKQKLTIIPINTTIVDSNDDNVVDESDVDVYQYLNTSPYTVEDLNSHVVSVNTDNPRQATITLDGEYPDNGYTLRVEYLNSRRNQTESAELVDRLEEKYMLLRLYEDLEPYKLQHGMTTKDINGLNITYDQAAIQEMKKALKLQIVNLKLKIAPLTKSQYNNAGAGGLMKSVTLSKGYNSNSRHDNSINSYSASPL